MANQTKDLDYMLALSLAYEDTLRNDAEADIATINARNSSLFDINIENEIDDDDDDDGFIVDDAMNLSIGSFKMCTDDGADNSADDGADNSAASADSSFVSVNHEDVSISQSTHDSDDFEFVLDGISSIDEVTIEYINKCSSITDLQHILRVLNESKSKSPDLIQSARNKLAFLQHETIRSHLDDFPLHIKQNHLLMMNHASKCDLGPRCTIKFCAEMKELWEHIKTCREDECKIKNCNSSRALLAHYRHCISQRVACKLCGPVRNKIQYKKATGGLNSGDSLANISTHLLSLSSDNERIRLYGDSLANIPIDLLSFSSDNECNRLHQSKFYPPKISTNSNNSKVSENLRLELSRPNLRRAIEIYANEHPNQFGYCDGRLRIPIKKLTKIFGIRKTSAINKRNEFQKIVNEECELESRENFVRLLVLKDVPSDTKMALLSETETKLPPKGVNSSSKVTIADIENCCSLSELKEILSKLSQSTFILPGHIRSAKKRLEVLNEAFFNDGSHSDDLKENNSNDFGSDYEYEYDDSDDDDGSNDDNNLDNNYNNDNVGQLKDDGSNQCAHALKKIYISSDKEEEDDKDDKIMNDVETKSGRPLSQSADNLYEPAKRLLSLLEYNNNAVQQTCQAARGAKTAKPNTVLQAYQAVRETKKAIEVEKIHKLMGGSFPFGNSTCRYMYGGNGDDDDDSTKAKRMAFHNLGHAFQPYMPTKRHKKSQIPSREYIENCSSIEELRTIILDLRLRGGENRFFDLQLHGDLQRHGGEGRYAPSLLASAKKRLQTLSYYNQRSELTSRDEISARYFNRRNNTKP